MQYGFSKALLGEVISAGWDQVDINNYVLYYNSQVETTLAVRAPETRYEHEADHQCYHPDQITRRTRRAGDWPGDSSQPEGTIYRRASRT